MVDKTAIGGTAWRGTGPYTLTADRTLAGNVTVTAPMVLATASVLPQTWYNTNRTIEYWVTDSSSGPKGYRWNWDSAMCNDWSIMSVSNATHGTTTFPGVGKRPLYVFAYDNINTAIHGNNSLTTI